MEGRKCYIDLTEDEGQRHPTHQVRRERSPTLEVEDIISICGDQIQQGMTLETPRATRKRRINRDVPGSDRRGRSPTPTFISEVSNCQPQLTAPNTPSRRGVRTAEEHARLLLHRRNETQGAHINALQNFEARRVDQLERMRSPESLVEAKKRDFDYSKGTWDFLEKATHNGVRIVGHGKTDVELNDRSFMRVFAILRDLDTGEIRLRGLKFFSIGYFNPLLPRARDEICLYQEIHKDVQEDELDQAMVSVRIECVVKERRIRFTNRAPSTQNSEGLPDLAGDEDGWRLISETGTLRCSWKFQRIVRDIVARGQRRVLELVVARLRCEETDAGHGVQDKNLLADWRKYQLPTRGPYTLADLFCGAGGAGTGGRLAGLRIDRAVDNNIYAHQTYSSNFGGACRLIEVFDYCRQNDERFVCIAHYSPPCQFMSLMNSSTRTQEGFDNNERNRAALFSLHPLLMKDRPRIVTMENTAGMNHAHSEDMWPILSQFTTLGYSIRFGILNMADYGVPQNRKRFILIGSCPGEKLPSFPSQTHRDPEAVGMLMNLPRWIGTGEAIDQIPRWADHHNPRQMPIIQAQPYPRQKVFRTLMTNWGGKDIKHHYAGRRNLTLRELATMQGFPFTHRFPVDIPATQVQKQIGNAVPATFMRLIFREAIKTLRETDRHDARDGSVQDGRSAASAFEIL